MAPVLRSKKVCQIARQKLAAVLIAVVVSTAIGFAFGSASSTQRAGAAT
jgi:hypothetical protein